MKKQKIPARGAQTRVFHIDVGDLPPVDAMAYIKRVKKTLRRKKLDGDADYFVPNREGRSDVVVQESPSSSMIRGLEARIELLEQKVKELTTSR